MLLKFNYQLKMQSIDQLTHQQLLNAIQQYDPTIETSDDVLRKYLTWLVGSSKQSLTSIADIDQLIYQHLPTVQTMKVNKYNKSRIDTYCDTILHNAGITDKTLKTIYQTALKTNDKNVIKTIVHCYNVTLTPKFIYFKYDFRCDAMIRQATLPFDKFLARHHESHKNVIVYIAPKLIIDMRQLTHAYKNDDHKMIIDSQYGLTINDIYYTIAKNLKTIGAKLIDCYYIYNLVRQSNGVYELNVD
ncbi:MAG TPA: hypothetical protein VLG50_05130 [Candidatus Saccharimonadales bacterium]|nr:hypothetical protein [Candidatus Saccharimonadales bacterium]